MEREEQLKLARQLLESGVLSEESANAIKADFPELAESEDERIIDGFHTLLKGIRRDGGLTLNKVPLDKCEEWLEKQKEQKPSTEETELNSIAFLEQMGYTCIPPKKKHQNNSDAPKNALGGALNSPLDKDKNLDDIAQDYVEAVKEYNPELTWDLMQTAVCYGYHYREEEEQKPNIELIQRSWYMEGYHDREFGQEPKWIIKTGEGGPKYELNPRYGQSLEQKPIEDVIKDITKNKESATKFLKSAGIMDDNGELAEMYRSEQKPAEWSEEDEDNLHNIKLIIENFNSTIPYSGGNLTPSKEYKQELISLLKSLRPQPHWKPNKEQMAALNEAINEAADSGSIHLNSWRYNLLKEIKEKLK